MASTFSAPPEGDQSTRTDLVPIGSTALAPYGGTAWPVGMPRPEMLSASPDPLSLLNAFRRRWVLASSLGVVLGIVGCALALYFIPNNNDVAALIQVAGEEQKIVQGKGHRDPNEVQAFRDTQMHLLKSEPVIRRVVRDQTISQLPLIKSQADKEGWLESELTIKYYDNSELLRVSMSGEEADQLVKIVNKVVDVYFKEHVEKDQEAKYRTRQDMQTKYEQLRKEIVDQRTIIKKLSEELGVDPTVAPQLMQLAMASLANYLEQSRTARNLMMSAEINTLKLENQIKLMEDPSLIEIMIEEEISKNPKLVDAEEYLSELESYIESERSKTRNPSAKAIQRLDLERQGQVEKIEKLRTQLREKFTEAERSVKLAELKGELEIAKKEFEKHKESYEAAKQLHADKEEEIKKMKGATAELEVRKKDVDNLEAIAGELHRQLQTMTLEADVRPRVQKLMSAEVPDGSSSFFKFVKVMFCGVLGFAVAALGVSFHEFLARRISTTSQLSDGLGLRVVGALPNVTKPGRKAHAHSMLIESIDGVRANLLHCQSEEPVRVVMVTSALDREGKTTVASQLAASLARGGRRVLLVDGDLRRPTAHRLFELPLDPGLCEVLRGEVDVDDVIRPTRAAGLWMIPAGQYDLESIQALSKDGLGDVFDLLRTKFDFIVVDSAPVLTIADSLTLGQHVDAAILSVMRDVSQAPKVYEAAERLRTVGVEILGAVINGERSVATYRAYAMQA